MRIAQTTQPGVLVSADYGSDSSCAPRAKGLAMRVRFNALRSGPYEALSAEAKTEESDKRWNRAHT